MKHFLNRIFWIINLALLPKIVLATTTTVVTPLGKYIPGVGTGNDDIQISTKWTSLKNIIAFAINFATALGGGILVIMLLVGGIMYLTGAGNEEQTGKAKKLMIDAVIGLFLVMSVYAISSFVIDTFK